MSGEKRDYIQANVNGALLDARQPAISPLDRGFLYGDAIYEVWRTYQGVLFTWQEHWERLESTAAGVGLKLPFSSDRVLSEIRRTVAAWGAVCGRRESLYARLQISRGGGAIGLDPALADEPCFAIFVKGLHDLTNAELDAGARLIVSRKWRRNSLEALPPTLKTGNYLNNIQGLREARQEGADDVVFLNAAGHLTEASTRNVWLVFGDRIATPPLADGLLSGVTRRVLLESIRSFEDKPLVEETLTPASFEQAEECFLSSSTQDVQPVRSVDTWEYPVGGDTTTRRLKTDFLRYVDRYVAQRQELRVYE